jgi:AraC family transcriptional regulator
MTLQAFSSFAQWYTEGPRATYVRSMRSPGGILNMLEAIQPPAEMSDPAVPDLVLHQDLRGGSSITANLGGGRFDITTKKGGFVLAAPNFANHLKSSTRHHIRSFALPVAEWQDVLNQACVRPFSFECLRYNQTYNSPVVRSTLRNLWALSEDEGAPSLLLARAAGCEILAELCRLGKAPLVQVKGGLAPWAERRCLELMRARISEDVSLDELAAEAQLSPFHFARMFKQSLGVPPRVYLTRLRIEKACELLETTGLPVTEIAFEAGYSSNQALARVFFKHQRMSPSEYRRAVRDPVRQLSLQLPGIAVNAAEQETGTALNGRPSD